MKWNWYYKAPPLLIPSSLDRFWTGAYEDNDSYWEMVDFISTNINHDICLKYLVKDKFSLIFLTPYCFSWIDKFKIFVSDEYSFETENIRSEVELFFEDFRPDNFVWNPLFTWQNEENIHTLFNSTLSAKDSEFTKNSFPITLELGSYQIETANYQNENINFKFIKLRLIK